MGKRIVLMLTMCTCLSANAQETAKQKDLAEPIEVVRQFLTAYKEGNHETFSSLLHPDVVWIQPGENSISGVKKSKAELMQMGAKMSELTARTLKLTDVKYFAPSGNTVVCVLHWNAASPTGPILDVDNIDVYTVENGKIIMARIFSDDISKEDEFWGK